MNRQSTKSHLSLAMNIRWILLYMSKDMSALAWIMVCIWTEIGQCNVNIQMIYIYDEDIILNRTNTSLKYAYFNLNITYIFCIDMFGSRSFQPTEYEPICIQNFGVPKYFAVYIGKTYSNTLGILYPLQPPFCKQFPNFLNYKSTKNTYEYTVFLKVIMESDVTNMTGNLIWNNETKYGMCQGNNKQDNIKINIEWSCYKIKLVNINRLNII